MRRAAVAGVLALWSSSAWSAPAARRIEDFLPLRLDGAEPTQSSAPERQERIVGAYLLPGKAEGDTRHVAITFIPAPDAVEVRDATIVLKPGKTIDFSGYGYEGLRLGSRFVQRACAIDGVECQVDVMLAKRVLVSVRVERPVDRDEPLRLLAQIDLNGLEAFARKSPPSRAARAPDALAARLRKEEAKLVDIWRAEQRAWLKAVGTPASAAASASSWTAPPAAADSLTADQIQRGLGARSLGVRACYEVAAEENTRLAGGEITVSFTVEPSGSIADAKIEAASTLADQGVQACVLRQLHKASFPAAREATSARHTFGFSSASLLFRRQ